MNLCFKNPNKWMYREFTLIWIFKDWFLILFFWFVFNKLFQKDEVYLNLVLDYVPETVYRVARHYSRAKQTLPVIYVKVCKNGAVSHFRRYLLWAGESAGCVLTILLHHTEERKLQSRYFYYFVSLYLCTVLKCEAFTF